MVSCRAENILSILVRFAFALLILAGLLIHAPGDDRNQFTPHLPEEDANRLFRRDNLVAWCIVPFDAKKRGPEERAAMLKRLGFQRFAYDWRGEHISSFDAEMDALKKNGIRLQAFWFPGALNQDARTILDLLRRHNLQTQLWV